jgi:hypothetical protein
MDKDPSLFMLALVKVRGAARARLVPRTVRPPPPGNWVPDSDDDGQVISKGESGGH